MQHKYSDTTVHSGTAKKEINMDKTYKAVNDALVDYAVTSTKQIVELNTKLMNDYIELNKNIVGMFPGLEAWIPAYAKR